MTTLQWFETDHLNGVTYLTAVTPDGEYEIATKEGEAEWCFRPADDWLGEGLTLDAAKEAAQAHANGEHLTRRMTLPVFIETEAQA